MKRDLGLMRKILLRIEKKPDMPPKGLSVSDFLDLCENESVIVLHLRLMMEAGWIEADALEDEDDIVVFRLTFSGYEALYPLRLLLPVTLMSRMGTGLG